MAMGNREASVLVVLDQAEELLQITEPIQSAAFLKVLLRARRSPEGVSLH